MSSRIDISNIAICKKFWSKFRSLVEANVAVDS